MENKSLSIAFGESLKENTVNVIGEIVEVGLDSIITDGLLKEIPLVSTAVALYKIGNSIKERYDLKKFIIFIQEINNNICDKTKRDEYIKEFKCNKDVRNQEIEYLLILIDRYISYDKPIMLAKLFMAYLERNITWEELTIYAEVIDRFLPKDCAMLISCDDKIVVCNNVNGEVAQRLVALGLLADITDPTPFVTHSNGNVGITWNSLKSYNTKNKEYIKTEFGEKLAKILG